jgi:hypothetical protein
MVNIPINIKDARINDAKKYIFLAKPIPMDDMADPPVPQYTPIQWITYLAENYFKVLYARGVEKEASQASGDTDIFE